MQQKSANGKTLCRRRAMGTHDRSSLLKEPDALRSETRPHIFPLCCAVSGVPQGAYTCRPLQKARHLPSRHLSAFGCRGERSYRAFPKVTRDRGRWRSATFFFSCFSVLWERVRMPWNGVRVHTRNDRPHSYDIYKLTTGRPGKWWCLFLFSLCGCV